MDELISDMDELVRRTRIAMKNQEVVSIAYQGNVVDIWERFYEEEIFIHLGSDQTSLHNPWSGGYYPVGIAYEEATLLIKDNPSKFEELVKESLRRHASAVNKHTERGTYFFDYGNAFLLESSRFRQDR